jgi:hypothetical protein
MIDNTTGNIKVLNNQLESHDAPVKIGKQTSALVNTVPSNIEVRLNHFTRPASWYRIGAPDYWHLRSMIMLHNAKEVLIEANVFDTVTFRAVFRIEPERDDGSRPWAEVSDITFRHNRVDGVPGGWEIHATDLATPGPPFTRNITVDNNLVTGVDLDVFLLNGGDTDPITGLVLRHNTVLQNASIMVIDNGGNDAKFLDNVLTHGSYGVKCNGGPSGTGCLDMAFATWEFDYNLVITTSPGLYPTNSNKFPMASAGFVDESAGNYRLTMTSPGYAAASDGKDMGVDFDAMDAAAMCRTSP